MSIQEIETSRLCLRRFVAEDVDAYFEIRRKPAVARFLPSFRGADDVEIRARTLATMASFAQHWAEYGYGPWAAVDKEHARLVGHCGLRFLPEHGETEILYAFDDAVWGSGLATEGARALVRYGMFKLGLDRVVGLTHPDNEPSKHVLMKSGLQPRGMGHYYDKDLCYFVAQKSATAI